MEFKKAFISELKPAKYNPRKDLHPNDPEYQKIKKSIEEFGYVDPVIVNSDYTVIGGHQRLKVLKEMGQAQIDVVVVDIPKNKEKALNVALNKIAGEWDDAKLLDLLQEIKLDGLLDVTGFDDKEFAALERDLHKDDEPLDTEPQISRAEELRKEWGTELGQIWQCGEHRVICGDCTDPAVVKRLMKGEMAVLCFTSPPYSDARNYGGTDLNIDTLKRFIPASREHVSLYAVNLGIIRKENKILRYWDAYIQQAEDAGLSLISWNIWNRESAQSIAQQTAMFPIDHEWIFVFGETTKELNRTVKNKHAGHSVGITDRQKDGSLKPRGSKKTVGDFRPLGTVVTMPPHKSRDIGHPAMFPVGLPVAYLEAITNNNDPVYDPFLGSGTTMIACENLGRKCRGCEIDPGYVAVELQRYKDTFPGKEIRLIKENSE